MACLLISCTPEPPSRIFVVSSSASAVPGPIGRSCYLVSFFFPSPLGVGRSHLADVLSLGVAGLVETGGLEAADIVGFVVPV